MYLLKETNSIYSMEEVTYYINHGWARINDFIYLGDSKQ